MSTSDENSVDTEWFRDYANIVTLTSYMADNHREASEVAYAVEKPWKFADEFFSAQQELDSPDGASSPVALTGKDGHDGVPFHRAAPAPRSVSS